MKKQIELNREYWGRVIDMCKGTALEGREWECVMWCSDGGFGEHPSFSDTHGGYELAVAVVEDKPVFRNSELYCNHIGCYLKVCSVVTGIKNHLNLSKVDGTLMMYPLSHLTWRKPEPKRTFLLNGIELPCPVKRHEGNWYVQINGNTYWFKLEDEANKVHNAITTLLDLAEGKE